MPATFTRHPTEIERKDPGIGGKPPVDRRPTGGGGDGENWDNQPHGRHGPRELLIRYRLGVMFALAGDLWLNTAVLLLSSATMEMARRQLFHEIDVMEEWLGLGRPAVKRAAPWLAATLVLGLMFLAGQWIAWEQLVRQGFYFTSPDPSSHFFYLITGIHGLHLLLGIFALIAALVGLFALKKIEFRQVAVDSVAWYWHTMGLFWVFLFVLLVFFQ